MVALRSSTPNRARYALLVASLILVLWPAAQASADHEYKFFHHNISGNSEHTGNDTTDDPSDPVNVLKRQLTPDVPPVAASINEICANQLDALVRELQREQPHRGWDAVFATQKTPDDGDVCRQDGDEHFYGLALVSPRLVRGSRDVFELPHEEVGGERRKLLCARIELVRTVRACTTHIAPPNSWGDEDPPINCWDIAKQDGQISVVAARTEEMIANGQEVVLMGDFNAEPGDGMEDRCSEPRMDRMYNREIFHGGAFGAYKEVGQFDPNWKYDWIPPCRCGDFTREDKRIDYIFANNRDWWLNDAWDTGTVSEPVPDKNGRVSDHRIVRGKIHLKH